MTVALRHFCRHDRSKLAEPTDNPRRAFCCRGCFQSFFRNRCLVCEAPIRRKSERQRTCIDHRCKAELRRFPLAYSWPETTRTAYPTSNVRSPSKTPDFIGSKWALRSDRPKAIWPDAEGNGWRWEPSDFEHRLIGRDGKLAALVWAVGDRWHVIYPAIRPAADLEAAKRLATSVALANLPVDDVTAARVARDNARGSVLRPRVRSEATFNFHIAESKSGEPGPIPTFLLRI